MRRTTGPRGRRARGRIRGGADADHAYDYRQYWYSKGKAGPSFGLNPGSRGPDYGIFQISADDDPTTVRVASGTSLESFDGAEPGYLVQLAPTD